MDEKDFVKSSKSPKESKESVTILVSQNCFSQSFPKNISVVVFSLGIFLSIFNKITIEKIVIIYLSDYFHSNYDIWQERP